MEMSYALVNLLLHHGTVNLRDRQCKLSRVKEVPGGEPIVLVCLLESNMTSFFSM